MIEKYPSKLPKNLTPELRLVRLYDEILNSQHLVLIKRKFKRRKKGWGKEHYEFHCGDGIHNSFWKTVITSPQWEEWEKEVARRMSNHVKKKSKVYTGVWDVDECRECGWLSPEHFQDFLKWIEKL